MGLSQGCKPIVRVWLCGIAFLWCQQLAAAVLPQAASAGTISIDATSFEVDGKQNILMASGNVVVKHGDVTLYGNLGTYYQNLQQIILSGKVRVIREKMNLSCDRAIAYGVEDRIEVTGNVVFVREDINGRSGAGLYDRKAQTVLLSGNPKVWQNRDELTGKTILVDIRRSKVTTYGGAKAVFSVEKFSGR